MPSPRLLAAAIALSLLSVSTQANHNLPGIVTQADDANLGTGPVSEGANVYDGDRLSTDEDGALTFRGGTTMLYLARGSRMTVHSLPNNAEGTQAILTAGTLVFTANEAAAFQVSADTATIRPIADTKTVGQITLIDPKTLYVYARQGTLSFFYEDETEVVPEGKSYKVILDPPDDTTASRGDPTPNPTTNQYHRHRGFLFILLGVGAAIGSIIKKFDDIESPDHP
jgi:hypothetical protein